MSEDAKKVQYGASFFVTPGQFGWANWKYEIQRLKPLCFPPPRIPVILFPKPAP